MELERIGTIQIHTTRTHIIQVIEDQIWSNQEIKNLIYT